LIKGKPFFLRDKVSVYDGFSVKENYKTRFNSGRALTTALIIPLVVFELEDQAEVALF
jgi:hypothetical protein